MRIRRTYLILSLTAFSFLASSMLVSLASFTEFFAEYDLVLNLSNQEEENETNGKEEIKEVKEQILAHKYCDFSLGEFSKEEAYYDQVKGILAESFHEVITPPPELG